MSIFTRFLLSACTCILPMSLAYRVQAQQPSATITLRSVKPTATGLDTEIQVTHVGFLGIGIEKQNKGTGNWVSVVNALYLPIPGELNNSNGSVDGHLLIPVMMPGKDERYRLSVFAKTTETDPRDFVNDGPIPFDGYDAPTQKPIATSINLQFSDKDLTISAKTEDKVVLKASWQIGGSDNPVGLQATQNMQNPKVALNYGALPQNSQGGFPAMDIGLFDESGIRLQEARIAVSVAATKPVTDKVKAVKDQPDSSGKSSSTKFSWSDLAKTGLGALMKYFIAI